MSLPHFYLDDQVIAVEAKKVFSLRLAPDDMKHMRALRLKPGEHVAVIDAVQDYFECEIVSYADGMPLVSIARHLDADERLPRIVVVQGLAKGDKMDAVIRQGTEMGVVGFVPLICERSIVNLDAERTAAKTRRWRAVAKSAAMQSGQRTVPEVMAPAAISDICDMFAQNTAVLVCWEEAPRTARISDALSRFLAQCSMTSADVNVAVVIGPEGGLTQREVDTLLARCAHVSLVSLGSSILRTETAGIVAPALVLYELGGLGNGNGLSPERRQPVCIGAPYDAMVQLEKRSEWST